MTDTDPDTTDDASTAEPDADESDESTVQPRTRAGEPRPDMAGRTDGGAIDFDEGSPLRYVYWGTFAVLVVLSLVAVVRFYMSASRAISIWVASDYVPIFQSAFNLAVLFACALGLSVLVRRMRD